MNIMGAFNGFFELLNDWAASLIKKQELGAQVQICLGFSPHMFKSIHRLKSLNKWCWKLDDVFQL